MRGTPGEVLIERCNWKGAPGKAHMKVNNVEEDWRERRLIV